MSNIFQVGLIEHDRNEDDLLVWQYPAVAPLIGKVCEKLSTSMPSNSDGVYVYTKYKSDWIYLYRVALSDSSVVDVNAITMFAVSRSFHPEKFHQILKMLVQQYKDSSGDPSKVLEGYLSIFTTGNFSNSVGKYSNASFNENDVLTTSINNNILKELFNTFSQDFVILWNAILLKKRILVFEEDLLKLNNIMRSLALLALHRKDFSILRPIVINDPIQLEDLSSCGVYIAGTTDVTVTGQSNLYDVIVMMQDHKVTVANHALSTMKMCSIHRDFVNFMTELNDNSKLTAQEIAVAISKKTSTTITTLKGLSSSDKLSESDIVSNVNNEATQQWLLKLATAENLI